MIASTSWEGIECEEVDGIGRSWPLKHGLRPRLQLRQQTRKFCCA